MGETWETTGTEHEDIPDFTLDEIKTQVKQMAKKKSMDVSGLVVEMLQEGSDGLLKVVTNVLSEKAKPRPKIPSAWKESHMKALSKKGNGKKSENYRPITLLRILFKLYSWLINERIKGVLETSQSADQAGFRKGYSVDDNLFVMTMLREKCEEFNLPLWDCAIDFRKAFDSVEHLALWTSLVDQGVPRSYVKLLAALYTDQSGKIVTDKTIKPFDMRRGTKQGDPMSPQLFNSVLSHVMEPLQAS